MNQKLIGISSDLIFHPGETLQEILINKGITQKELATITGFTPAFISNVLNGKKNISAKFATKLSYALGIPSSYFLRLQAHYDDEIARFEELNNISEIEKNIFCNSLVDIPKKFKKRFDFIESSDPRILVSQLREFLRVGNLEYLNTFGTCNFRIDANKKIDNYSLGAWVRIADNSTRELKVNNSFDTKNIHKIVNELKNIMNGPTKNIVADVNKVFSDNGVAFNVIKNIKGAPVQGYLGLREDNAYQMVLTVRQKFADIFWFSLFHELGHLYYNDINKNRNFIDIIDYDKIQEEKADAFAANCLLDPELYQLFIKTKDFNIETIKEFAKKNNVQPYIVIGRLQKEKKIEYSKFISYKIKYNLV